MARRTARKSTMPPPARARRSRELVLRHGRRKRKAERNPRRHGSFRLLKGGLVEAVSIRGPDADDTDQQDDADEGPHY
jgi:hypothetical protein